MKLFSASDERKLKLAFELYSGDYCNTLPSSETLEAVTFSKQFEKRMEKLLTAQKKAYYYFVNTVGKRVAVIILSLIIGLTATTFGVKAIRQAVLKFITEVFDTHTKVSITLEGASTITVFEKTQPQYVPEGFQITINTDYEDSCRIVYRNQEKISINYKQLINSGSSLSTDTENAEVETVYINSLEGIIYKNKGFNKVIFGNENYFFTLNGKVPMEELIKMAESIPIN